MNKQDTNQSGFGLIEVILIVVVLAGMGTVGYYAWSQSNQAENEPTTVNETSADETTSEIPVAQYDNKVRADISRLMNALEHYAANHNGRYPYTASDLEVFEAEYNQSASTHPVSDLPYTIDEAKADSHEFIIYSEGICDEDGVIQAARTSRQITLSTVLPSGERHCQDNN